MSNNEVLWWHAWYQVTLMPIDRVDYYNTRAVSVWANNAKMVNFLSPERDEDFKEYQRQLDIADLRKKRAEHRKKLGLEE